MSCFYYFDVPIVKVLSENKLRPFLTLSLFLFFCFFAGSFDLSYFS